MTLMYYLIFLLSKLQKTRFKKNDKYLIIIYLMSNVISYQICIYNKINNVNDFDVLFNICVVQITKDTGLKIIIKISYNHIFNE